MGLQVYWYDFVCFGIVGVSVCCALWVIRRNEGFGLGESVLWKSCWKGVHPKWLLFTRSLSFLILTACLAWDIYDWDASIFVYYTEWTFTLVMVYFALGMVVSAHACWVFSHQSSTNNDDLESETSKPLLSDNNINNGTTYHLYSSEESMDHHQKAAFWGYLMQTAFQICAGAVILTDIVFWCIIVPFLSNTHLGLNLLMGCMHTLNALFLLLDTALNSLPFPWFRLSYFVLWSCLYVIFQWVIHACGFSWWPYPFLELDTPWAPLWYFCLAVIHIPCYGIYALIVKAKYNFLPKWFPQAFVTSC